ncbi:MAG: AI-2E family transporter [Chloroflexi bacterium]|nr:AI-2E family transporter [Chloroflexota bacterium]
MSEENNRSPNWSSATKVSVGLVFVAIIGALLIRFNNIIGPLLLTFMLSYILHPLASRLSDRTNLSWRASVNLIYISFVIIILLFLSAAGFALVQQLQNLVDLVIQFTNDLPTIAEDLADQNFIVEIGTLKIDLSQIITQFNIDVFSLSNQVISILQPLLGNAGKFVGSIATSALVALAWGAFILIISYFILSEAGQVPNLMQGIELLPGFGKDLRRLGREVDLIWHAFLRGQLALFIMIVISSFILLTILGVRNTLGLALLAGLAKFVPYIGPIIASITTALVAFFQQEGNYFNIEPWIYALIVVIAVIIMDQIFDNLVTPRIFGKTLGVHPAAVLISAFIAASLIGFIGLLMAAPVLASLQLFGRYALRKLADLDPWPEPEILEVDINFPFEKQLRSLWSRIKNLQKRMKKK